jgi:hypothetical protein
VALRFGIPGMRRFVRLQDRLLLPLGSRIDTRRGRVRLSSARGRRRSAQSATLSGAAFSVRQGRSRSGLTTLTLRGGDFSKCATGAAAGPGEARAAGGRRVRRLFGRGRGRFRTRGRNSSATVRGTVWSVEDRCDGTLTTVRRGTVRVFDRVRRRTVILRSGQRYLAKNP